MAAYASFDPSGPHVNSEIQAASRDDLKKTAALVVKDQAADTHFFDANLEAKVPRFDMTEIRLGRILGRGGFCVVTEIEKVKIEGGNDQKKGGKLFGRFKTLSPLSEESNQTGDSNQKSEIGIPSVASDYKKDVTVTKAKRRLSRNGVAKYSRHKTRKEGGRYALKQVSSDLASFNKVNYLKGLVDLAIEAKFLSSLDHPNIVQLCGVSSKGFSEFIIVERLQETLSMRFSTWMKVDRQCTGITGVFTGSKIKKTKLYEDRINAAYDIACGVDYLHDRNIIFRDLKPDNIGFDGNDVIKIFDFGLAKELQESQKTDDGLYKMTGFTGAVRYMAPEVGLGKPYNLSVDVYSWSIIMWFILALEPPFGFYTEEMIMDRVFKRGSRPAIFDSWSKPIGDMMKKAWESEIADRPTFKDICSMLRLEMLARSTDTFETL